MSIRRAISLCCIVLGLAAGSLEAATSMPFRFVDGMIWFEVSVPGQEKPLNFILDSGAGESVLDLSAARRLGLKLGERQSVQGVQGRTVAYRVKGFTARANAIEMPSSLLALDLSGPSAGCHQRIDGLLGADFLWRQVIEINYAKQVIRLLQSAEINAIGCEILPLSKRNDTFCTKVCVDGNEPQWMRLDTGCSSGVEWVVTPDKARKLSGMTFGVDSGGTRQVHTDLELGRIRLGAVKTGIHTAPMFAGEAGLIGNEVLAHFCVTIDLPKSRLLLAKARRD